MWFCLKKHFLKVLFFFFAPHFKDSISVAVSKITQRLHKTYFSVVFFVLKIHGFIHYNDKEE